MDLRTIRNKAMLTQEQVSAEIGMSRAAYSNIEIGKRRPSVDAAKRIAKVLGFDWTKFFE